MGSDFNRSSEMVRLYPAYGRKYRTTSAMLADWMQGKDFRMGYHLGPYCSIRDSVEIAKDYNVDNVVLTCGYMSLTVFL